MFAESLMATGASVYDFGDVDLYVCTDCKSLYDSVLRLAPATQDKRTQIELASVREMIPRHGMRWVPTHEMKADALTKISPQLRAAMGEFIMDTGYS